MLYSWNAQVSSEQTDFFCLTVNLEEKVSCESRMAAIRGLTFSTSHQSSVQQTHSILSHSLPTAQAFLRGQTDCSVPQVSGRFCLWAFGHVSPLFKTLPPPPPFLQILPKLWGPTQLYFLSSELTRHFYPHHAMKDRTAVQLAGEVDSGAVLPVWPWLGAFLSLHFFIYKNGNNNCI